MKKRGVFTKILTLSMAVTIMFAFTGCANTKPKEEQITDITNALLSGDAELFYASMEENEYFDSYFDAVKSNAAEGLPAVYVKMQEKMKKIEVEPDSGNESFDIPVSITYYDAYSAALDKMYEAALEGPEAFADMPTWLCAALDESEMTTESVSFNSRKDTSTLRYQFYNNEDFFKKVTCGMYDFMNATMTTCSDEQATTLFVAKDDEMLFSVDYYYTSLEDYDLSEEELSLYMDALVKEYEGYDGLKFDIKYDEAGITEIIFIDYSVVSTSTLVELGYLSDTNVDVISLEKTIEEYEKEGITCVTEHFGITPAEATAE